MALWISVLGLTDSLTIEFVARFAHTFGSWIANHIALMFIKVIHGTPTIVQVALVYFILPVAFNNLHIDPFSTAAATIVISSGVYIVKITHGAVFSIHRGFSEADLALELPHTRTIRHAILPLALRRMLPPLGNQWIISTGDTLLLIAIGVVELTHQDQEIIADNFRALEVWNTAAVFYLITTLALSFILHCLERRTETL